MTRCPNCDAHREEEDDYCPVCGETFPGPNLSEATGPRWYEHSGLLIFLALLAWPAALYGLFERDAWDQNTDQWLLIGCLVMASIWVLVLRAL
jgi:hypothetical protein